MNNQEKGYSILPALLFILAIFCSVRARADMYKYVDDKGTVSITDDLAKVPEKYRSKIEAIKEQKIQVIVAPAEKEKMSGSKEPAAIGGGITAEGLKSLAANKKVLVVALVSCLGLLAAMIFILNRYVNNRMVTRLIFVAIAAVLMVFLYKMYAENVYRQFSDAKKSAEDAKKLIEQKQKEQMKGLDDIVK
ncbi:MAG TPA: DUF4124 domain-containing protein [Thermodesulfobacteriota bacterium]|nr:DUF4124 domain-containing protein [Thermodesulfobacteriota bacterium]